MKKLIQTIDFIEDFMRWSTKRKDIRAVALVGSYAKRTVADSADVNLLIIASDPQKYLASTEWLRVFGAVIIKKPEVYGKLTSLRVWYENGLEIVYGFTTRDWAKAPLEKETKRAIDGGLRVLFEKEALLAHHETPHIEPIKRPNVRK